MKEKWREQAIILDSFALSGKMAKARVNINYLTVSAFDLSSVHAVKQAHTSITSLLN